MQKLTIGQTRPDKFVEVTAERKGITGEDLSRTVQVKCTQQQNSAPLIKSMRSNARVTHFMTVYKELFCGVIAGQLED